MSIRVWVSGLDTLDRVVEGAYIEDTKGAVEEQRENAPSSGMT